MAAAEEPVRAWSVIRVDVALCFVITVVFAPLHFVVVLAAWLLLRGPWDLGGGVLGWTTILAVVLETLIFSVAVWSIGPRRKSTAVSRRYALAARIPASTLAGWVAGGFDGTAAGFGLVVGLVFGGGDFVWQALRSGEDQEREIARAGESLRRAAREVAERDQRAQDGIPEPAEGVPAHSVLGCADARLLPSVQYLRHQSLASLAAGSRADPSSDTGSQRPSS